ncbi:MAG TPA: HEAT repeat domain-containing protein [Verrucomicrobiae bacterium]|nr:HEAT repeat domain-containing protein [Verrucomicrobiae bacterium]
MFASKPFLKAGRVFGTIATICFSFALHAADVENNQRGSDAPIDAELAIKQFKVPDGFKIDLWAKEPQLENPVAFTFDEKGRVFVAETFRYKTSVYDIRDHMNMYFDDLASRTVEDRVKLLQKYLGDKTNELTRESEIIQLVEDRSGKGMADHAEVFASGFNTILDGIGAGILARKGEIYYTDIPNLWQLSETNGADRKSLSYGYGVRFGYTGHDLHGLRIGPDGKLYFTIGDRALNVITHEGKHLDYSEMGSVLRCNLDGSDLEVFAYGVRNPQELAFDNHGNLFTGDNNCDHGDAARLVYVVEGGDSGWRTANQFSETTAAGVWNSENLWHTQFPEQAAYIVPPIAYLGDGPSGLAHNPGIGFPPAYDDHFFLCDFRGASVNSGVHSFGVSAKGAGFTMIDHDHFFWHILATDCDFSPDGQLFVTDWVRGWPQSALGRIYRVSNTNFVNTPLVLETKKIIADGMEKRPPAELEKLLSHADQRVRQEAQFEMVDRALAGDDQYTAALTRIAAKDANALARLHGIWGVGQIGRSRPNVMREMLPLLNDADAEVRAQTAKVLGEAHFALAFDKLTNALADASLRVRFFAALSLGKLGNQAAVTPLVEMLRTNADQDVFLRHAGVMGLLGTIQVAPLLDLAKDPSRSVRMAALLVMRRRHLPQVEQFLHDSDQLIVLEAARAINDLPITESLPQLAEMIDHPTGNEMLDWRIVNANYRLGSEKNAAALGDYALNHSAPEKLRSEALQDLGTWDDPDQRDRLTGMVRPLARRDPHPAAQVLEKVLPQLLHDAPGQAQITAILAVRQLYITNSAPALRAAVADKHLKDNVRVAALHVLGEFGDPHLTEAVGVALADPSEDLHKEGNRWRSKVKPGGAVEELGMVVETGSIGEKQGALTALGTTPGEASEKLLADWMDKLNAGKVQKEIQFDVLAAATARNTPLLKAKLQQYADSQPKDDEFNGYRAVLYGGDAVEGKRIFFERPDASCVRCHKIKGEGGAVGPDLTDIIKRHDREYILESILYPNKVIAPGFESVLVEMKAGQTYAGVVKSQDDTQLSLFSIEDNALVKLKKSDIKTQVKGQSPMPEGIAKILSKGDLRNLVEYLATQK